jgi:isopenicillin N synthase-like dioxygenase
MATTGIPTVDLAKFVKGDAASRASFVQELGSAFREIGFVAVSNHGIPQEIIDAFYSASKRYFSMPLQTKLTHFIPGVAGQRGLYGVWGGARQAVGGSGFKRVFSDRADGYG